MTDKKIEIEVNTEPPGDTHATEPPRDAPVEDMPRRARKITAKGLQYTRTVKKERIEQICRGLEKQTNHLLELIDLDTSGDEVKRNYKQWVKLYDEFLTVDVEYQQLLEEDEIEDYTDNWFMARNANFLQFKARSEQWFASIGIYRTKPPGVKDNDDISLQVNLRKVVLHLRESYSSRGKLN